MRPYIITVEFRLRTGCAPAFLPLIRANARRSLADEPGCRRFDVLVRHDDDQRVFLYEIYDDEAAFEAHCRTPHFHEFDTASRQLCESKMVQRYTLIEDDEAAPASRQD
ncbi:MAG: putative quinol monooxygenase [Betaproteobacteria bacterium]